jgi:hypothetical protein
MKKLRRSSYIALTLIAFVFVAGMVVAGVVIIFNRSVVSTSKKSVNPNEARATVIRVDKKPNIAEDGHLWIFAQNKDGQNLRIDASGFMNYAPRYNRENGSFFSGYDFDCLDATAIGPGDGIEFYLPQESQDMNDTTKAGTTYYSTCFDKNTTDSSKYFLRIKY